MNAMPTGATRPLIDLLGARWKMKAPAASVAWDGGAGRVAGFGLGDGSLAVMQATWDGAPTIQARAGGGVEMVPGTAAPPPVLSKKVHDGACLSVAGDTGGGFLTGGEDGQVVRVQPSGAAETIARFAGGAATPVLAGRGGWRACAVGRTVHRIGHAASSIEVAAMVASLALDPTGARLAVGHDDGVTLWAGGDLPRVLPAPGTHKFLAWSHDGLWLGSAASEGVLYFWRMPDATPITISVGGSIGALGALPAQWGFVSGAGGRVLCWRPANAATAAEAQSCGTANQADVTRVACHPVRPLVAAGYANGAVILCRPGSTGVLFLRGTGEGAISALAYSPNGDSLAVGTDTGEIAVVPMPDLLFRDDARSQ